MTAGVFGAFLVLGVMALSGHLRRIIRIPVIERVAPPGYTVPPGRTAELARRLQPAVVNVVVESGGAHTATGAGVMFRTDGHFITNSHVVRNATRVMVVAANGTRSRAQVVAADEWSDLAVVKIDDDNLAVPVAVMGSTSGLSAAQEVLAIGGRAGLASGGPAVTLGAINSTGRVIAREDNSSLLEMIETDIAVPADASGGGLFDRSGALVGILTALTPPGGSGHGYATPIDWARRVAEQLLANGRVIRVWVGIRGDPIPPEMATSLGVPGGLLVEELPENSPAVAASVSVHDVITAVDGAPVDSMDALRVELRTHDPGDVVTLQLVRKSTVRSVQVTLVERPA